MAKRKPPLPDPHGRTPAAPEIAGIVWGSRTETLKQDWLIRDMFPRGTVVLVEGRKGRGKSSVLAALTAALTGGPKPPGWVGPTATRVLWVAGEDNWSMHVVPRLGIACANLEMVGHLEIPQTGGPGRRPTVPGDIDWIEDRVREAGAGGLVIDPLNAAVSAGHDLNQDQQIANVVLPLLDLAWKCDTTVFLSRNLSKRRGGDPLDQGLGGAGLANRARAVIRIQEHPTAQGLYVAVVLATNYGRPGQSLTFRFHSASDGLGYVVWEGTELLDTTVFAEVMPTADEADEASDGERLLFSLIGSEWVRYAIIRDELLHAAVSERTLRRCKIKLGVRSRRVQRGTNAWWEWGPPKAGWPDHLAAPDHVGGVAHEGGHVGRLGKSRIPRVKSQGGQPGQDGPLGGGTPGADVHQEGGTGEREAATS